jgi:spore coat protein CotH
MYLAFVVLATSCAQPEEPDCKTLRGPVPEVVADEPGRLRVAPDDEAAFLFDHGVLREFDILIDEADLASIDADPVAEEYVPATLVFDGVEYPDVAVRYKGSVGAWVLCVENSTPDDPFNLGGAKTCPKLGMKVSFTETDPSRRFFGLQKLQFHAMNLDHSLMRERLGYWMFQQMGVASPRAVHARVSINGEFQGVFINVEQIDGSFTRSRFADGEGNLYKEVWPTWSQHQPELTEERLADGLKTNEDQNPSFDRALAFSREVMSSDPDESARALADWMNVDNTQRMLVVDRAIGADDGPLHFYCDDDGTCENKNFYVYEETASDRFWMIPWDLDNAFVTPGESTFVAIRNDWRDAGVECEPVSGATTMAPDHLPPSCDPLLRGLGCFFDARLPAIAEELLEGPYGADIISARLTEWEDQIRASVVAAHQSNAEQLDPDRWSGALQDLRTRTDALREHTRATYLP